MNRLNNVVLPLIALITSAAVGCAGQVEDTPNDEGGAGLAVRLAALEPGSGRIEYSLTNHTSKPVRVLGWKTGLYAVYDPLFEIYRDGSAIDYRGPIFHHAQPVPSDFVEVAPGERLSAEIDLTESYDLRDGGTYEVRPVTLEPSSVLDGEAIELNTGAPVRIQVDAERAAHGMAAVAASSQALTAATSCTPDDIDKINVARGQALNNAREAKDYFTENSYDERALRWFGTADIDDTYYVGNGLHTIFSLLDTHAFNFQCWPASYYRCWLNTLAFVNPWDTSANKVVNFCALFFKSDPPGRDSRAVTVTHEVSHFYTKLGDFDYFVEGALKLAKNKPDQARSNAENYALYTIDSQIPCVPSIETCGG
jgi:peptidyl-Lys metalloendopeptidase